MTFSTSKKSRNVKIIIEYDGTNYSGWQRQKNAKTVQEELEAALFTLFNIDIKVIGSGRTDAGVHSLGQVANLFTKSSLPLHSIVKGANANLPRDIRVVSAEEVPQNFNARRNAVLRHYRYQIINRSVAPAILRNYFAHVPYKLDILKMEKAYKKLKGEHNFQAFRSSLCTAKRTVLTLEEITIKQENEKIYIDFKCRSFLHNMVRIIAGLLIEIGRGKIPTKVVDEMLKTGSRPNNVPTAPPQGLFLVSVEYSE